MKAINTPQMQHVTRIGDKKCQKVGGPIDVVNHDEALLPLYGVLAGVSEHYCAMPLRFLRRYSKAKFADRDTRSTMAKYDRVQYTPRVIYVNHAPVPDPFSTSV